MINSVNTLDLFQTNLITMDKFNNITTARMHHTTSHNPARTYLTIVTNATEAIKPLETIPVTAKVQEPILRQERVKVQHLENHTKLQNNNCWNNFRTLLTTSSFGGTGGLGINSFKEVPEERDYELQVDDIQHTINIQNKSAFNLDLNTRNNYSSNNNNNNNNNIFKKNVDSRSLLLPAIETNNNHFYFKHHHQQQQQLNAFKNKQPQPKAMMVLLPRRTEDQEHAYRRIESVHNYAKLKSYDDVDDQSPNASLDGAADDEEADDSGEEDDVNNNDADYDVDEDETIDLDADYEDLFNRRRFPKLSSSSDGAIVMPKSIKKSCNLMASSQKIPATIRENSEDDLHIDVDVETVENPTPSSMEINNSDGVASESLAVKPDHHARRPMNAFLIFCKRHRAIVKERYKTLENRAITKILGDWWASLDANDKMCFTSLAQQNKDAFFSANPNFKWYKLPAPPLRTLNTRPTNTGGNAAGGPCVGEYEHTNFGQSISESISNNNRRSNTNYFKLADEAQMGDLSQLMQDKSKTKQCALQQVLGETSQFISSHITGSVETVDEKHQQGVKRPFYSENSFSSNSSEEDGLLPKKKTGRSCKGKRYQELINSGQISAPAVKKSKSSQRLIVEPNANQCYEMMDLELKRESLNVVDGRAFATRHCASESENLYSYDLAGFDLEEKIKELPALGLDDYLQRKRNTKKKKKLSTNGKKRNNRNTNANVGSRSSATTNSPTSHSISPTCDDAGMVQQRKQQQQQAVGSQKRKARKESITRRDISAIEQEVASLLPLTINGCCYFQEAPMARSPHHIKLEKELYSPTYAETFKQTSPIIPLTMTAVSSPSSSSSSSLTESTVKVELMDDNLNDNIISSTSDLLILAEVAANRTELKH